jgi:hypothetical protein
MVYERTGRLLYLYDPENDVATGDGEPIREIAAVWDVEVLSAFLGCDDFRDLIVRSLDHFEQRVVARDGYAISSAPSSSSSMTESSRAASMNAWRAYRGHSGAANADALRLGACQQHDEVALDRLCEADAARFARSHARKPPIKPSQRLAFVGPD